MIKNYLKIAVRNLQRQKVFSFINITGMSIGMACCILIFLFINDELSYDNFHSKKERIHRIIYNTSNGLTLARAPITLQPVLTEYYPEIETAARVFIRNASVIIGDVKKAENNEDKVFEETQVMFTDPSIKDIFTFEPVSGDIDSWLEKPFTVVLDEETAIKYFGDENPVGKTIYLRGDKAFTVAGVVKDFPENSHFHFNILIPFENMYDLESDDIAQRIEDNLTRNWIISHTSTYVLLKEGQMLESVNKHMENMVNEYAPERMHLGQVFSLQPLKDIHLHSSEIGLNPESQGDIQYIYVFGAIAIITLLIASFNFINLSTAQSIRRAKEVGMRKVMGAKAKHLFAQFLGESVVVCFFGFVLSLGLVNLVLPQMNDLTGKVLTIADILNPFNLFIFIGIFLVTGILGGSYPAFFISKLNMITTLKGKVSTKPGQKINFRQLLVIVQFAASIILITGALLIFKQLNFLLNRPLGFKTEKMLTIPLFSQSINTVFGGVNGEMRQRLNTFEDELLKLPDVNGVTLSSDLPGISIVSRMVDFEGKEGEDPVFSPILSVDYDFVKTYNLELASGRDFNIETGTDHTNAMIINEQTVKEFNFGSNEEAIGKEINIEGKDGTVIGVIKDFHYINLRSPIGTIILHIGVPQFSQLTISLNSDNLPESVASIETKWKAFFPEKTFEFNFLDESILNNYQVERRLGNIIAAFAILAIFVSCLGSYGLIMHNAKQREKEIGVRKVLGANFRQLVVLLFKDFTILYGLSFLIAFPVIYYFSEEWLSDFNYRIGLPLDVFLIGGFLTLSIVWLSISFQSIKTALLSPVKCLRDE
ncbi:ABC transporter permease [Chondrinema litorale]|uniref:ABC transporter permease n=1 Tax=Chondrinema litorale TaxID=2994555 RepID=UPI002543DDE9|nr:ABC transporter permease [Chondrinema litorale]UZR93385.1 ABC transporter permease [Chondrinema litorale]